MKEEVEEKIEKLRKQIDEIDQKIIYYLNERAKVVLAIKELKSKAKIPIFDPRREKEIFKKLVSCNQGPLYDNDVKEIYEKILHCMKSLEKS